MMDPTLPGLFRLALGSSREKGLPLIPLRHQGERPPIFCLYGLHGDVYHYLELANALGGDQPVYGIRSLALDDLAKLPQSIEEAGERAIRWIRQTHAGAPPVLVGYSWGGNLAFEIARQWVQNGGAAPLLILVGTDAPRRRTSPLYRAWHLFRWLPAWVKLKIREGRQRTPKQMAQRLLKFFVRDPADVPQVIPHAEWANHPIARHLIELEEKYHPFAGPALEVHLIRESECEGEFFSHPLEPSLTGHLPDLGWSRWAKRPAQVHWIEADHESILRPPAVKKLAARIRALMDQRGK
jgi:thioesterase domain-containing protein